MKFLIALIFVLTSSIALAEEVSTDCPWSHQDGRTSGKNVKTSSSKSTKSKGSTVKGQ